MYTAMDHESSFSALTADHGADRGWHISFRLTPGMRSMGFDPRDMLGALAEMGVCQVIGRNEPAHIHGDAGLRPIGWDMVLVGNTTRAAIEDVFLGMPAAMELVIQQIH
ncbi:hypothetical protein [Novosphingobium sp.]|uniref:hypothetical protein n=1 Tax=Novosphingobium sp. TaxID=1874826 RepID=UPI003D0F9625